MDNLTIDEKRKYYDKMYKKYKDIQKMPEDVLAKVFKYGNDTDYTVAKICLDRLNNLKKISR